MTLGECCAILDAPAKWVHNACAALGLPLRYRPADMCRLGLTRRLAASWGVPLAAAWRVAGEALARSDEPLVRLSPDPVTTLEIDVRRYLSEWAAACAGVRELAAPRSRGRPRRPPAVGGVAAASRYGINVAALAAGLRRTPAERLESLDENWRFVRALRHRRGRHA
ncbi:MAG TPA: hypothetical protein VH137_09175 [Gemmatimonadales bacterium]|nr:hypothetical protein [Gemmatimonadales bacterium]